MNLLHWEDASSELDSDVWEKLERDTADVRFEAFASACMSRDMPIKDTTRTRGVSDIFWGFIDNVSSQLNRGKRLELMTP